MTNRLIPKIT